MDEVKKKSNKGLIIFLVVLVLLLLGGLGFGAYKYVELDKNYNKLSSDSKIANEQLNSAKDNLEKVNKEAGDLKEGYIKFGKDYKIYALEQHNSATYSMIIGYDNNLYNLNADENGTMCISKIADAKFDKNGDYTCKLYGESTNTYIHKFDGKESDLSKIVFSIWYSSSDGAKYPIIIYKSGEIETTNEETAEVLKDYKIKDFINEECGEFESNSPACKKGKATYEVILQNGEKKTITK